MKALPKPPHTSAKPHPHEVGYRGAFPSSNIKVGTAGGENRTSNACGERGWLNGVKDKTDGAAIPWV
jgi:hypothetical protein